MRTLLFGFLCLFVLAPMANAENGLIHVKSGHDVATTVERLKNALETKGMKIFTTINHAEGATSVGVDLAPTRVIIFGNPKVGSALMKCGQSIAIDLPQKALIWEDSDGKVWLSYNDPNYLAKRHEITGCDPVVAKIQKALSNFAKVATSP